MSFWGELRRRNVVKVGAAYAIVGWLLVQAASIVFPALALPEWALRLVIVLLVLGLPIALIYAQHIDIGFDRVLTGVLERHGHYDSALVYGEQRLRPGGILVYAVCSLQPEEGPELIAAALRDGLPLERFPVAPAELPGLECAVLPQGDVRTLPSFRAAGGGMDGFYLARFRRCG